MENELKRALLKRDLLFVKKTHRITEISTILVNLRHSVRHRGSEIIYHLAGSKCINDVLQIVRKAFDTPHYQPSGLMQTEEIFDWVKFRRASKNCNPAPWSKVFD